MRFILKMILLLLICQPVFSYEHQDVGLPGLAGSVEETGSAYTINASGADIWGSSDEFHYMYLPISGDLDVSCRVASFTGTNAWRKAGVMIRESLYAGSRHSFIAVTGGNGVAWQSRPATDGGSTNVNTGGGITAPYWVRLVRQGNTFTGYRSDDGVNWTLAPSGSTPNPSTLDFPDEVYVGIAVTSHEHLVMSTAVIDNIVGLEDSTIGFTEQTDGDTLVYEKGANDSFSVQLKSPPAQMVSILIQPGVDGDNGDEIRLNDAVPGDPVTLQFTAANWNVAQVVTVTAVNDGVPEEPENVRISFSVQSDDPAFAEGTIKSFNVLVIDWDGTECPQADMNGDCIVGMEDLLTMADEWLDPIGNLADLTLGGGVTLDDYDILAESWADRYGPVIINEFLASNGASAEMTEDWELVDEDGESSDWIELYNITSIPIDIGGWYLTNKADKLDKWQFPAGVVINPGKFLIVFASDKNRTDPANPLHTDFDLDKGGEYLALVSPDGKTIIYEYNEHEFETDLFGYPEQKRDISYGVYYNTHRYFAVPSPNAANSSAFDDFVDDTKFSVDRGFYDAPINVEITCETPDATIIYTTDGSEPTENNGIEYIAPLNISKTTCLRAAAFRQGWKSSDVDCQTYIFLEDVIRQGQAPEGFPATWNGHTAEYGMDPDVVGQDGQDKYGGKYAATIKDDLKSIPTVSIVMDVDHIFGSSGIYSNPTAEGVAWERPGSVELIDPDDPDNGFHVNCGVRIYGGVGRQAQFEKHTFRFLFKSEYGPSKLDYQFFGPGSAKKYDTIILRSGFNNAWHRHNSGEERQAQFIRDEWARRTQLDMGNVALHGNFVHLYVNGLYWGLYNPVERGTDSFMASYFEGDRDEFDTLNSFGYGGDRAVDGTYETWVTAQNIAAGGLASSSAYKALEELVNIPNLIDYLIINFYGGNYDWDNHNWYAGDKRQGDPAYHFFCWDTERILEGATANRLGVGEYKKPSYLYKQLKENTDFRLLFADRVYKHFFHGGELTPERAGARYQQLADIVDRAIVGESARWGDSSRPDNPYTRDVEWLAERDRLLNSYFPVRTANVLNQFKNYNPRLYPSIDPPDFLVEGIPMNTGGTVDYEDQLTLTETGNTRYYTTDGTDPRVWAFNTQQTEEFVLLDETDTRYVSIPVAPTFEDTGSIAAEFWTGISGSAVSDLTGNAAYPSAPSYIEQWNQFELYPYDIAENYGIRVSGFLHPPVTDDYTFWIATDDNGKLFLSSDDAEQNKVEIAWVNAWTNYRQWNTETYQKSVPIHLEAGQRYYIEAFMKENGGGDNLSVAWQAESIAGTDPVVIDGQYLSPAQSLWYQAGYDTTGWTQGTGVVGYETKPDDSVNYTDAIDIDVHDDMFNVNSSCYVRIPFELDSMEINTLSLKMMCDDGFVAYLNGREVLRINLTEGITPQWDTAATGSNSDSVALTYQSYDISNYAFALKPGANLLAIHGLNRAADNSDFILSARLVASAARTGEVSDAAQEYTGPITMQNSMLLKTRSYNTVTREWSALHEAKFMVGDAINSLRVTEIMYHPADPNHEYIEFKNTGDDPVSLNMIEIDKAVDFTFGDITLEPGEYIVAVRNQAEFEKIYGEGINIAGQYSGAFDNAGEKVKVEDLLGNTIQSFDYKDSWYELTDGLGFSLTVMNPESTDPNDWDSRSGWRASFMEGGSPGNEDFGYEADSIVINEILAHSHDPNPSNPAPDWIELYNKSGDDINIGGWFLSDQVDNDDPNKITKYEFPADTIIESGEYLLIYEDQAFGNNSAPGCHIPFGLSEGGETLYLHSGKSGYLTGAYQAQQKFDPSERSRTIGRYEKPSLSGGYDFVRMEAPTEGYENTAGPMVGPLVISEILYDASDELCDEYIVIRNITSSTVELMTQASTETAPGVFIDEDIPWEIKAGIDYVFDNNVEIKAGKHILLVKDPVAFKACYPTISESIIFGPYSGRLDNKGDKIKLVMPGDKEYGKDRYFIPIDEVEYNDKAPWPIVTKDQAIERIDNYSYGNDPENWTLR